MQTRLYYITDRSQFPGDEPTRRLSLLSKIGEAAGAGVDYIQLREKDLSTRDLEMLARDAVRAIREQQPPGSAGRQTATKLLINSRTDVALASGADGVHLRSDDVSPSDLRRIWTSYRAGNPAGEPLPTITVSCHHSSDVLRAKSEGADFAVFAPVFEKKDAPHVDPRGLPALREACAAKIPVLALGGVTIENAASCLAAGAAGIAGIRLFQETRIEVVVTALRRI